MVGSRPTNVPVYWKARPPNKTHMQKMLRIVLKLCGTCLCMRPMYGNVVT
jgi:hypothetical protein